MWKYVGNLVHQKNLSLAGKVAEMAEITYGVDAIDKIWMVWLKPILEDILNVGEI